MITNSRRTFLQGCLSISLTGSLAQGAVEDMPTLFADGENDDSPALNALLSEANFRTRDGFCGIAQAGVLRGVKLLIGAPVYARCNSFLIDKCTLRAGRNYRGPWCFGRPCHGDDFMFHFHNTGSGVVSRNTFDMTVCLPRNINPYNSVGQALRNYGTHRIDSDGFVRYVPPAGNDGRFDI